LTVDKAVPVAIQYRVVRDGKPLPTPARLESGARFVIEIKQSTEAYVYAVLIDSRNRAHRLYPASLTGTDNPVRGDLRIPKEPGAFLVLDEITGTERILIFAQQDPSPVIERELKAVTDRPGGDDALQATTRLDRVHQVRGIYVEKGSAPEAGSGEPGFAEVISPLGRPVAMFTIEHTSVSASLTTDGRTTRRP
jgi:hypothetical protein